jgi:C-terminal processing protease CtpA/Prc
MVYLINDMHVSLYTPYRNVFWNGTAKLIGSYPSSKLVNICKYLNCNNNQNSAIYQYRDLQGYNVGYILIKNFEGEGNGLNLADSKYNFIDDILEQFKNKDGLIIDVRSNQGGNMYNPPTVASRFADMKRTYFKFCLKNGPSKNDFSDWMYQYIEPSGKFQYKKPIIVITSRATSSAAELFVLAMKSFPYVITVGDTTGGGFGLPIFRELPNGWSYRLSTAIGATQDNLIIEGRGIPPDFPVITAISDSINGVDQLMEKSIEVITTKISK